MLVQHAVWIQWIIVYPWLLFISQGITGQSNLYDTIRNNVNTTKFADMIDSAMMRDVFVTADCSGAVQCLTVFVPDNAAVDAMAQTLDWQNLVPAKRTMVIYGHILKDSKRLTAAEWVQSGISLNLIDNGFGSGRQNTLAYLNTRYAFQTKVANQPKYLINRAGFVTPDIQATNGMVHVINHVLYTPSINVPFVDYLVAQNDLKKTAEFWMTVGSDPKYTPFNDQRYGDKALYATYFLVTDDAWNKIPQDKLKMLQTNKTLLAQVLSCQYLPNQIVYKHWTFIQPEILLYSGFPTNPGAPDIVQLQPAMFTRSPTGQVSITSGGFIANLVDSGEDIKQAVVYKINAALGFVYETRDEVVRRLSPGFLQLCQAISTCNSMLTGEGQLTFFLPNDFAMAKLNTMNDSQKTIYLKYLVLPGRIERRQMTPLRGIEIDGLSYALRFRVDGQTVYVEGRLPKRGYVGAQLIGANNLATNGIIHLLDGIPGLPVQTVEQYLSGIADYSKYAGYQFVQTQTMGGPYIYFAPTNQALQAMESETAVGVKLLEDTTRRNYIFRRHSFPLTTLFEDLRPTSYMAPTANFAFTAERLSVQIKVPNAQRIMTVTFEDQTTDVSSEQGAYEFTNGWLYRLDKVLYNRLDLTRNMCTNPAC
ncbi:uncharacterized protein DEA37_0001173 [Paragonimus westermani]|uniref:FAS1 domain-containing protein n=1 Tax=Paragonimus westermani TaxID=34504 RepID=A0A5J4NRC4_9TREM|nr:uncharacterized protein DEA37_0001173 [Paragonimus westermani]